MGTESVQGAGHTGGVHQTGNGGGDATHGASGGDQAQNRGMQALIQQFDGSVDGKKDGKLDKEEIKKAIETLMGGQEAGGKGEEKSGGASGGGEKKKGEDLNGDGKVDEKDEMLAALLQMMGIDPAQLQGQTGSGNQQPTTH